MLTDYVTWLWYGMASGTEEGSNEDDSDSDRQCDEDDMQHSDVQNVYKIKTKYNKINPKKMKLKRSIYCLQWSLSQKEKIGAQKKLSHQFFPPFFGYLLVR